MKTTSGRDDMPLLSKLIAAWQSQEPARDGDVVARHAIQFPETALGAPRLLQNDRRLVTHSARAIATPFDNHANGAAGRWRSEKLDRYIAAARKIAMKQSVSGASLSRTGISRHRVLLHNASTLLAIGGTDIVPLRSQVGCPTTH